LLKENVPGSNWERVQDIFLTAADLPEAEQAAFLDTACDGDAGLREEVESLLRADREGEGVLASAIETAAESILEEPNIVGIRLGAYRVTSEIGRGGIGAVYLAERDDDQYHKKVAIKIVKHGMDTAEILGRFRHERQILANLDHPYIARLVDGGTTPDGRPFFVLEFVEGMAIDTYCDEHELNVDARLDLFLRVCEAVSYAHRSLVIHRDLKPGNILVTEEGVPKLLDFGMAKLLNPSLDSLTETVNLDPSAAPRLAGSNPLSDSATAFVDTMQSGVRILTPAYASPEQVRGDPVTVASDIYSLAASLYELLTGKRPHIIDKHTPQAIEHAICDVEVIRPSLAVEDKALVRRLSGDIDTILQRALDKDPLRRYASVEQFADDLRRHMTNQPVMARPDTILYRLRKFARRRRGTVAAAAAVLATLTAGIVVSLREASIARENLQQVRRLANAFVFKVHDAVRDLPGSTRARQLIISTGLEYLDALAKNSRSDWDLRSELAAAYRRIGDVQGDVMQANLGKTDEALVSYRKAMDLLNSIVANDPHDRRAQLDRILVYERIGGVHSYTGDNSQALRNYAEAEKLAQALLATNPSDDQVRRQLAEIHISLGEVRRLAGEPARSLDENNRALTLLAQSAAAHPGDRALQQTLANAYSAVGMSDVRLGRFQDGLARYRQALAGLASLVQQEPTNVSYQHDLMLTHSHIGDVLGNPNLSSMGDTRAAAEAYQQMLGMARHLYNTDPADQRALSDYAIAQTRVAAVLPDDRRAERLSLLRESLKLLQEVARINPQNAINQWDMAHGYHLLGDALIKSDRAGAIRAWRESMQLAEALVSGGMASPIPTLVAVCQRLGEEAARDGDRDAAIALARRAFEVSDEVGTRAKGRAATVQRFLTPEGRAAMGLVYAQLARGRHATPAQQREDLRLAALWLQKSLATWREIQSDPAFAPPHKRLMQDVEEALARVSQQE
jgi:eukaryotic-like serine/threonine-protein kinase